MKKLIVLFLVTLFSVMMFSGDDPEMKSTMGDCGDCVESEMDAPTGSSSAVIGYQKTYYISEECDLNISYDWSWSGEATITELTRTYLKIKWNECTQSGTVWVAWGREEYPCSAKSAPKYVTLELGRPTGPTGEEDPETGTYYNYQATGLPTGAESYGWLVTGGSYDFQGPEDEDDIDIRFNDSETTYQVRVRAEASCDNSSYNPGLSVTTQ